MFIDVTQECFPKLVYGWPHDWPPLNAPFSSEEWQYRRVRSI